MPHPEGSSTRAPGATAAEPLSESASVLLDIVRFVAALAVVLDHLSLPDFRAGLPNHEIYGYIAVPVFFVLSGFIIRFVTLTRETTLREYLVDRASRIYSVVLPAMLLTLLLSGVCLLVNPGWFRTLYGAYFSQPLARVAFNLSFLSQAWGHNTIPFINIPFWSMGYECPYYVLYAFAFFLRGWKRLLGCAITALLVGPQVLFLFPVWLLGCLLYQVFMRIRRTPLARTLLALTACWFAAGVLLWFAGHPFLLSAPFTAVIAAARLPNPLLWLHQPIARSTMLAMAVGMESTLLLLVLLLAADLVPLRRKNIWARRVRRVADGTFSIYLMHFPLLVTATALGLVPPGHTGAAYTVAAAIVLLLTWAAGPVDALKRLLRSILNAAFAQHAEPASAHPRAAL